MPWINQKKKGRNLSAPARQFLLSLALRCLLFEPRTAIGSSTATNPTCAGSEIGWPPFPSV
jgi:hypothetical protein